MKQQEEVGDLFVTEKLLTLKLLPSGKSGSKVIRWFVDGAVVNNSAAAKDIAGLVNKLRGRSRVVRNLTLMTDRGAQQDITSSGLPAAVAKAGFNPLN
ncbi:MAG: hypothetical protein FD126_3542 [Elusimicrobia bacterium]|nr:MAG: hypothetical protein FD126_3542 [Elusimicrobiota bacterium]